MSNGIQVSDKKLTEMRIISVAMVMGAAAFLSVVLFMLSTHSGRPISDEKADELALLTTICLVCTAVLNLVGPACQRFVASQTGFDGEPEKAIQTGLIARLALGQGTTLFGAVVLFMSAPWSGLSAYIWCNMLPFIVFCMVAIRNFPTRTYVEDWLGEHIDNAQRL